MKYIMITFLVQISETTGHFGVDPIRAPRRRTFRWDSDESPPQHAHHLRMLRSDGVQITPVQRGVEVAVRHFTRSGKLK